MPFRKPRPLNIDMISVLEGQHGLTNRPIRAIPNVFVFIAIIEKSHFIGCAMRARVQRSNEQYDSTQCVPLIVPLTFMNADKSLLCYLTGKTMRKDVNVVKKHVKGKRFGLGFKESLERKEGESAKEKRKAKKESASNARRKGKKGYANGDAMQEVGAKMAMSLWRMAMGTTRMIEGGGKKQIRGRRVGVVGGR